MIKQRHVKYLLLIMITVLAIGLAGITGCARQNPFIPEFIIPPDWHYIEMTTIQIDRVMLFPNCTTPEYVVRLWKGRKLIIKNITVDEVALSTLKKDRITFNNIQCIPQKPSDLLKLKKGDVIDITGVFIDIPFAAGYRVGFIVLANCQFLPAGLYSIPLPRTTAPSRGY